MRVSIHQPNFLPWQGYFHKIINSDAFVFFDDVQFPRGKSYCSRVKIKTQAGEAWITVPVEGKSSFAEIYQIKIDNKQPWKRKHLKTIMSAYQRAPFFDELFPLIEGIYRLDWGKLADFNISLIEALCDYMAVNTKLIRSSQLNTGEMKGTEHILNILKILKTDSYLTGVGAGSNRYIEENIFAGNGIKLEYQNFSQPVYNQQWGPFVSNLSIVDLLFNYGRDSLAILKDVN